MERRMGGRTLAWGAALVLPTLLVLLFETRKWDRALMDRWVSGVMAPLEQQLGRFWGQISWCSAAELLTALLLAGCVLWLIWTVAGLLRRRDGRPSAAGFWPWPLSCCGCGAASAGCGTPPTTPPAFRRRAVCGSSPTQWRP